MELSIFYGKYLIAKDGIKHLFGNRYIITACKINYHDFNATKHGIKYIYLSVLRNSLSIYLLS